MSNNYIVPYVSLTSEGFDQNEEKAKMINFFENVYRKTCNPNDNNKKYNYGFVCTYIYFSTECIYFDRDIFLRCVDIVCCSELNKLHIDDRILMYNKIKEIIEILTNNFKTPYAINFWNIHLSYYLSGDTIDSFTKMINRIDREKLLEGKSGHIKLNLSSKRARTEYMKVMSKEGRILKTLFEYRLSPENLYILEQEMKKSDVKIVRGASKYIKYQHALIRSEYYYSSDFEIDEIEYIYLIDDYEDFMLYVNNMTKYYNLDILYKLSYQYNKIVINQYELEDQYSPAFNIECSISNHVYITPRMFQLSLTMLIRLNKEVDSRRYENFEKVFNYCLNRITSLDFLRFMCRFPKNFNRVAKIVPYINKIRNRYNEIYSIRENGIGMNYDRFYSLSDDVKSKVETLLIMKSYNKDETPRYPESSFHTLNMDLMYEIINTIVKGIY